MKNKLIKVAIIASSSIPIPAVCGGATETMMTHLIKENENNRLLDFQIFSYYNNDAKEESETYKSTQFNYYKPHFLDNAYLFFYRAVRKLTGGKTYLKSNFIKWCIKNIKNSDIDIVLVEGNHFQILQLKKALDKKLVLHMHIDGLNIGTDNGKNIVNACNKIIAISDFCKNKISEIDKTKEKNIVVLKNTIDVNKFIKQEDKEFEKKFRLEHNLNSDEKIIVYCGRISKEKGILELLQAFNKTKNSNCTLMIIGESFYLNSKPTPYLNLIKAEAEKSNKKIIFTGYVKQKDLPKYYSLASFTVVPSLWEEAAGNVIIEALSCGLPVIATNRGGIPEYADKAACCLIDVTEDFSEKLAEKIDEFLSDDILLQKKSHKARECALKYSTENYYNNFYNIIKSI